MPPPSLSTTTTHSGAARRASPSRPLVSWSSATSPTSSAVGAPARATPTAVDTTPSMPLAPRLAWTASAGAATREPLEVADRHRGRHHEGPAVGHAAGDGPGDTRLVERPVRRRSSATAASTASSARRHRPAQSLGAVASSAPELGQDLPAEPPRFDGQHARGGAGRGRATPVPVDEDLGGVEAAPATPPSPSRRRGRRGAARAPGPGAAPSTRSRASPWAITHVVGHPAAAAGVGEHGPAEGVGERRAPPRRLPRPRRRG